MSLIHWNYFLALEEDLKGLSRYIKFNLDNIDVYSIELARIIMGATQEVDVLMKQLCKENGDKSDNENSYRRFIPIKYPNIVNMPVSIATFELSTRPFLDWENNKTPEWWTANNRIKHHRNTDFKKASLDNAIGAMAGLLLANIYFYCDIEGMSQLWPNPKLLDAYKLVTSITPTKFGNINNYQLL